MLPILRIITLLLLIIIINGNNLRGNTKDTYFSFDRYGGYTERRQKQDSSSIYLDLTHATPKGEPIRVYVLDGTDKIHSNKGDFFYCELGKKYLLYNTVFEKGNKVCYLWMTGHPEPIYGYWSPDSVPDPQAIILKEAYVQTDLALAVERANDVLGALIGNVAFKFHMIDENVTIPYLGGILTLNLKTDVSIKSTTNFFCKINHSIDIWAHKIEYDYDITFKDNVLSKAKELLNKLLGDKPIAIIDKIKFAVRDGTFTFIPYTDGFQLIIEFKRDNSHSEAVATLIFSYLKIPNATQTVLAKVKAEVPALYTPLVHAFDIIPSASILSTGFILIFAIYLALTMLVIA